MALDCGHNNRCFTTVGFCVMQSLKRQMWQDQGNSVKRVQRNGTIPCLWLRRFGVRTIGIMMWVARMVGSVLSKEALQELGGYVRFIFGAWVFEQSKVQWETGGKCYTLEPVRSAWAWRKGPLPRVSAGILINWTLQVRMESEGEILCWPLLDNVPP